MLLTLCYDQINHREDCQGGSSAAAARPGPGPEPGPEPGAADWLTFSRATTGLLMSISCWGLRALLTLTTFQLLSVASAKHWHLRRETERDIERESEREKDKNVDMWLLRFGKRKRNS